MVDTTEPAAKVAAVHEIKPNALYFREHLCRFLRCRPYTLRSEVRQGKLRSAKLAGRQVFLGKWILEWVEQNEITRGTPRQNSEQA